MLVYFWKKINFHFQSISWCLAHFVCNTLCIPAPFTYHSFPCKYMYTSSCSSLLCYCSLQSLPNFGPYRSENAELLAKHKDTIDLLAEEHKPAPARPVLLPKAPVPSVQVLKTWHYCVFIEVKMYHLTSYGPSSPHFCLFGAVHKFYSFDLE